MEVLNAPAPQGSTEPAASQVTTQTAVETTPQVEKPAGETPPETPAGETQEQAAAGENQGQEDKPKTWEEKRKERNKARWQEYKEAKSYMAQKLSNLESEVARLRSAQPPDLSNVFDPDEVIAEKTAWKVQQRQAVEAEERLQQERQYAAQVKEHKMAQAWQESVADAKARLPDFDTVVTPQTPIHPRAVEFIVESEKAADIAYFLGKNPETARSLAQKFESQPAQALIELGRIEARLSAPPAKTVSTAPRPAPTLNGGPSPNGFDPERASVADMQAHLRKAGVIRG